MAEQPTRADSASSGHELSDLNPNKIFWLGVGLALVIASVVLLMYGLFHFFTAAKLAGGRRQVRCPSALRRRRSRACSLNQVRI